MKTISTAILGLLLICCSYSVVVAKQQRDHLTPQEIDLVKEAQMLDQRTDVFIKAIDRRLMVISGTAPTTTNSKQGKKEAELWGDLPTGSRAELIDDIAKIFDEAITNIDDVSTRDERNPLIAKSLRRLAQEVNTVMTQITPLKDQAKTEAEIASFETLYEDGQQILAAAKKLPPEIEKEKTKGDKKKN